MNISYQNVYEVLLSVEVTLHICLYFYYSGFRLSQQTLLLVYPFHFKGIHPEYR